MKVLLLSSYLEGGAGGATYRLHQSLQQKGMASRLLFERKLFPRTYDDTVLQVRDSKIERGLSKLASNLDRLPLVFHLKRKHPFFLNWVPSPVLARVIRLNPDVINLHWILDGFLPIRAFAKLRKPLVWTLHDMWAFTGGCDYSYDCERYKRSCGACPHLKSGRERDLAWWTWQRKAKAWDRLEMTIVTPSHWLASCAKSSALFKDRRIEVIPYGIDTEQFKPIDRQVARERLRLPQDKRLVLNGAWGNQPRKGIQLLAPALQHLRDSGWHEPLEVILFGRAEPRVESILGFRTHYLGMLHDPAKLALAYAACDVFVHPSTQDNLPTTLIEALSCGTPSVAFHVGGAPDIITHQRNGYLARPLETEDLARGIAWVLEDEGRHRALARSAREKAEREFTLELQAQRYLDLFKEVAESSDALDALCHHA